MALSNQQRGVLRGMLIALTLSFVGVLGAPFLDVLPRPEPDFAARMSFALRWDLLLLISQIIKVGLVARHRFFNAEDIDGGGLTSGTARVKALQAMLQNTHEQVVIAVLVHLIWAATMPLSWTASLGVAASLFVVGRILFGRGYERGAPARALGFALTFYPSVLMTVVLVIHAILGVVRG